METTELLARLTDHEDGFTERKLENVKPRDIRRTLVAFANSVREERPGVLFIGVRDDGNVAGCQNTDTVQKAVRAASRDCYPPVEYTCKVISTAKGPVVAVIVPASENQPHFTGHAFVRIGSETVSASPQLFDELVHARSSVVRRILEHRNETFSVEALGHRIGTTYRLAPGVRQGAECRVLSCDMHILRLENISTSERYSVPTPNVRFLHDETRHRPKLVITAM